MMASYDNALEESTTMRMTVTRLWTGSTVRRLRCALVRPAMVMRSGMPMVNMAWRRRRRMHMHTGRSRTRAYNNGRTD